MKSEIIKRLFKEGHITIDEVIELSKEDKQVTNIEWVTQPNYQWHPGPNYPIAPFVPTCGVGEYGTSYKVN
jgi:hypothetical protein